MNVSMKLLTGGWVLQSANFEFEDGEIIEIYGPNPMGGGFWRTREDDSYLDRQ